MSTVLSLFSSPSVLQDNLQNLQEVSSTLMQFIKKMRNNLSCLERQQDQIIIRSKSALQSLDKEIQCELTRLQKDYPQRVEMITEPEKKQPIRKISNSDRLLVKQTIKPKINTKNIKQPSNNTNTLVSKNPRNRGAAQEEPYTCFICLWQQKINQQQSCHWNQLQFYLNHLQNKHNLSPSFDILLFGCYNSLPFSHAKINGSYYNLFKNHPLQKYQYLINISKISHNINLAICGCILELDQFEQIDRAIFRKTADLSTHFQQKHNGVCYPNSSLIMGKNNSTRRKKQTGKIFEQDNIKKYLKQIQKIMIDYTKSHSIQNLLIQANPISRLEIISRINVKWNEVFLPITSQQEDPTRGQILDYAKIIAFDLEKKIHIKDMSEEQSLLVNTQINLLKSNVFICGVCQKIFKKDTREFIVHVQSCQHYNPLNSHKLCFL